MASSLIESILGILRPEMTQAIAARAGAPPDKVKEGLNTVTAAISCGIGKENRGHRLSQPSADSGG